MSRSRAGVTLIEVLIAVSLLSLLSVGVLFALRVGTNALEKADTRLMANRRIAGTQRILEQQLAGFIPVMAIFSPAPDAPGMRFPFFEGRAQSMRFVSTYSLGQAARGMPQILEFQVIPGDKGRGVRLVVNETVYAGPRSAGALCLGPGIDEQIGVATMRFTPIDITPRSFVMADRLAYCRFSYLSQAPGPELEQWAPNFILPKWPLAIRIEMTSLDTDAARLKPVTVTSIVHVDRDPLAVYEDL